MRANVGHHGMTIESLTQASLEWGTPEQRGAEPGAPGGAQARERGKSKKLPHVSQKQANVGHQAPGVAESEDQSKLTISTQFESLPVGYFFSSVSAPLPSMA